jgi:hypothetical protein
LISTPGGVDRPASSESRVSRIHRSRRPRSSASTALLGVMQQVVSLVRIEEDVVSGGAGDVTEPAPGDPEGGPRPERAAPAYAGIGSRQTPPDVLALIEALAARLASDGWVLRTGLSPGADQAFYRGAMSGAGAVELYLPWPGFQSGARLEVEGGRVRVLRGPSRAAWELAPRFHPRWDELPDDARRLLARDGDQLLGVELLDPVRLVACWTADGSLDGERLYEDGTGQALRIAHHNGIPVLNLARPDHLADLVGP